VDMDISMDIHRKSVDYGYGYKWKILYPRQVCIYACGMLHVRLSNRLSQK